MKRPTFGEKNTSHHHQQQSTYNANFHSPSELNISTQRNKANEYHSLLNRLPTLGEILARKTESPVDLWSFYIFMKEHENAIDYLDFWLDVMGHLTLCKHYVQGLRESIVRSSVVHHKNALQYQQNQNNQYQQQQPYKHSSLSRLHLAAGELDAYQSPTIPASSNYNRNSQNSSQRNSNPLLEQSKHKSLSSSLLLDMIINDHMLEETDSHRLSQFLRGDLSIDNNDPRIVELVEEYNREHENQPLPHPQFTQSPNYQTHLFDGEDLSIDRINTGGSSNGGKRVYSGTQLLDDYNVQQGDVSGDVAQESGYVGRANVASIASSQPKIVNTSNTSSVPHTPVKTTINSALLEKLVKDTKAKPSGSSSNSFITRENLRESSHNLLLKYFVEDAEKKINIPKDLNSFILNSIEKEGRDDPDVFGGVRDYVFKLMENELYPKFLKTVAIQNITEVSSKVRMIAGLILLFFGFWIAYILLFLNYHKRIRAVCVVPFLIAFYLIVSSHYYLDPVLVFLGFSESFHSDQRLIKLKEKYVHRLLIKRAVFVVFLVILFTLILTLIFSLVPGHRL